MILLTSQSGHLYSKLKLDMVESSDNALLGPMYDDQQAYMFNEAGLQGQEQYISMYGDQLRYNVDQQQQQQQQQQVYWESCPSLGKTVSFKSSVFFRESGHIKYSFTLVLKQFRTEFIYF